MALCWLLIGLSWLGGLLSLMSSLMGNVNYSILIGPIRLKKFENRNLHSNEKMAQVKKAKRDVRTAEDKQRDKEDEFKLKYGNRKVQYMNNFKL